MLDTLSSCCSLFRPQPARVQHPPAGPICPVMHLQTSAFSQLKRYEIGSTEEGGQAGPTLRQGGLRHASARPRRGVAWLDRTSPGDLPVHRDSGDQQGHARGVPHPAERDNVLPGQARFVGYEAAVAALEESPEPLEVVEEWPGEPITVSGVIRVIRELEQLEEVERLLVVGRRLTEAPPSSDGAPSRRIPWLLRLDPPAKRDRPSLARRDVPDRRLVRRAIRDAITT